MLQNRLANTFLGILVSSLFISCVSAPSIKHVPQKILVEFFDLTMYAELGFLITPAKLYGGNYKSIGEFSVDVTSEANWVKVGSKKDGTWHKWVIEELDEKALRSAIDDLYHSAKEKGADAVVDFNIEGIEHQVYVGPQVRDVITVPVIRVSGFAIKRLD